MNEKTSDKARHASKVEKRRDETDKVFADVQEKERRERLEKLCGFAVYV